MNLILILRNVSKKIKQIIKESKSQTNFVISCSIQKHQFCSFEKKKRKIERSKENVLDGISFNNENLRV